MTTYFWQGSANPSPNDGDNWLDPLGPSTGTAPADGDSIVFDSTSDGNNDCQFDSANFPASGELVDVTISANFTKFITTSTTTSINLDGKLEINVGGKIKPTHSMTFDFNTAGTTTVYDGNGDSYTHKPLVIYNVADSMFNSESARGLVTFNFGALNLSMIDGIYPNITFTGTIYAKSIYSDTSRTLHNTYGSVDILTVNGGNIDSEKYNIYDYDKQFLFEKGFTSIGEYFRFGHTTARFVTYRSAGTGEVVFPVTGELNSAAFGNDTTKNFYTQYHKIIIENNDNSANYWLLKGGNVLECNEIVVGDGGRFYGPVSGTAAAVIRSVKRPNVYGDWNFREVTDGIYESITGTNVIPVSHGGTGRLTLTKDSILYGDGMGAVGLTTKILHPLFFERAALDTNAVDFRVPTVQSSTANPNGYPMPFAGTVMAATFLFTGTIADDSNTNTIRIRKNGGSSGSDIKEFTFTGADLVHPAGSGNTLVKTGSDVEFTFSAGDILQIKRQGGATDLNNSQALLWIKFDY